MEIRDAAAADESAWRRLWAGYAAFYETTVPEAATAATWARALDPEAPVFARLAVADGAIAGFSLAVVHPATWHVRPVCYLEDLFVDPDRRGNGIGRALLRDLVDRAGAAGCARLYWHTRAGNRAARRLYDRFAEADDFVRYRLPLAAG